MREIADLLQRRAIYIAAVALAVIGALGLLSSPTPLVVSRWGTLSGDARAIGRPPGAGPRTISGGARPLATPGAPGGAALARYNQGSQLVESAAGGSVQLYRRDVAGGTVAYVVVALDGSTRVSVITADGATLASDKTGDTVWADGGRHLRTVEEMVRGPSAARPGMELLGALAFGFHGDERTSDEGTVVIDGAVQRVNPGRSALCIRPDGTVAIGVLGDREAAGCAQAAGAGPVVMLGGKIVSPDAAAETDELIPFNPLGEDFVQLDWRRMVYSGSYPKTMIGVGRREDGRDYMVLMASYGIGGVDAARQLRAMGCTDAIGGDDDTSTQLVWRGTQVVPRKVRSVPTAVAVYARAP